MQQAGPGEARSAPDERRSAGTRWWQHRQTRTKVAVVTFAVLALLGMVLPAVGGLFSGDQRVLVVTLDQGAGQERRLALKAACGSLPGIGVVPDQGNGNPEVQGRFPVRFSLAGATPKQEAALTACVDAQPGVRGFLVESPDS